MRRLVAASPRTALICSFKVAINRICDPDQLAKEAGTLARRIVDNAPLSSCG
jgi:hypothetical protein